MTEVNPNTFLSFEPQKYSISGIEVLLSPIHWNGVEFKVTPSLDISDSLAKWALGWIDPEETANTDEQGLGNYVHSITKPTALELALTFSIDFGSSEIKAFIELLDLLAREGAVSVEIHSNAMIDMKLDIK